MPSRDEQVAVAAALEAIRIAESSRPARLWGTVRVVDAATEVTVDMDDGGTLAAQPVVGNVTVGQRVRVEFDRGEVLIVGLL